MKKAKGIGLFDIVIAGLSGAIGFEIFVLLNYAYFHLAGPGILLALIIGGVINLLIMLSYCELGAAMPLVGGEYTYIKTAYGGYVGFIAGCFRWMASLFAAALAAVTFVLQLAILFSVISPQIQAVVLDQAWLLSIFVVAILGLTEVKGVKKIGSAVVIAFILLFTVFIIGGLISGFNAVNLLTAPVPQGISGIFAATVYIFPMFIGTKALVAVATSAEKPGKNIPRGLLLSAVIIIPLYLLLGLVAIGTVPSTEPAQQISLLNFAAGQIFGEYGTVVFAIAGMVACLSALGTSLSVQSSIARGMSRDGYFPKILMSIHSRFGTNYIAAIVGSGLIMLLSVLGAVPFLVYAASFGSLLVFALVNLSLMKLRKTKPHMDRPFKTPLYPLTPILGFILSVVLLVTPMVFGDGNASDALASGLGLTAIVLCSYYLRMAGRFRAQIALGGIGLATGGVVGMVTLLNIVGLVQPIFPFIPSYVQLAASLVLIVAGYFNLNADAAKKKKEQNSEDRLRLWAAKLRNYFGKRFIRAT